MKLICLDTSILIWAIRDREGGQNQRTRARDLIESGRSRHRLMVPAPVLMELLAGTPEQDHGAVVTGLGDFAFLPSFDVACAVEAARIERSDGYREAKSDPEMKRQQLKFDSQIIATVVHRATVIVTENVREFTRLSAGRIRVRGLPPLQARQKDLF